MISALFRFLVFRCAMGLSLLGTGICPLCAAEPLHQTIDRRIQTVAGRPLAGPADDAEFLRRVSIDLTGKIPSASEAREFLGDTAADRRRKLIDSLLASDDYARRMQQAITSMLLERRVENTIPDEDWNRYLRESFAANKPWNQLVQELLFVDEQQETLKPASKFMLVSGRKDRHLITEDVARLFLGRDIQCAQCHDHPTVDDYTQLEYFGLFTYLTDKPAEATIEFESVFLPGKKTTGPRLPGGQEVQIPQFEKDQQDAAAKHRPRLLLSRDLPQADNPMFVRNSVNRFWFLMMGRGLVHPLHLHHSDNPASHPQLLDTLASEFVAHDFDVQWLLREIALSQSYQRSSRLPEGLSPHDASPERYIVANSKPLTPEQMGWCTAQATGNLAALQAAAVPEDSSFTYKDYINGNIQQVPDNLPDVMELFVGVFSNPPGEPEVEFSPAMGHALFLMNEPLILDWLTPHQGNLVDRLSQLSDDAAVADELYLSVLTRPATQDEQAEVAEYLQQFSQHRLHALQELAWALLSSAEFRTNH